MMNRTFHLQAEETIPFMARSQFAFLFFIIVTTLMAIGEFSTQFLVFVFIFTGVPILLSWLMLCGLTLKFFWRTRQRDCLVAFFIHIGWILILFVFNLCPRWLYGNWALLLLALRLGILLFILYANNLKYAFSVKFIICLLALCCDIFYFKRCEWEELCSKSIRYSFNDFIVYDCLASFFYALYTKFNKSQTN